MIDPPHRDQGRHEHEDRTVRRPRVVAFRRPSSTRWHRRDAGVTAEYVRLGAPAMDEPCPYRVDHRPHLARGAVLPQLPQARGPRGRRRSSTTRSCGRADDKFFGATLATSARRGEPARPSPCPNKDYVPGIVHEESLRNLTYPARLGGASSTTSGSPASSRMPTAAAGRTSTSATASTELIHHYDHSGLLTMVVQEFIEWEQFVRCLCLGREDILAMPYDPRERRYHVDDELPCPGAPAPGGRRLAQAGAGPRLRHELDRVGDSRRHALRHRLHEPGAGHGHQLADADLLRVGRAAWPTWHGWRSALATASAARPAARLAGAAPEPRPRPAGPVAGMSAMVARRRSWTTTTTG